MSITNLNLDLDTSLNTCLPNDTALSDNKSNKTKLQEFKETLKSFWGADGALLLAQVTGGVVFSRLGGLFRFGRLLSNKTLGQALEWGTMQLVQSAGGLIGGEFGLWGLHAFDPRFSALFQSANNWQSIALKYASQIMHSAESSATSSLGSMALGWEAKILAKSSNPFLKLLGSVFTTSNKVPHAESLKKEIWEETKEEAVTSLAQIFGLGKSAEIFLGAKGANDSSGFERPRGANQNPVLDPEATKAEAVCIEEAQFKMAAGAETDSVEGSWPRAGKKLEFRASSSSSKLSDLFNNPGPSPRQITTTTNPRSLTSESRSSGTSPHKERARSTTKASGKPLSFSNLEFPIPSSLDQVLSIFNRHGPGRLTLPEIIDATVPRNPDFQNGFFISIMVGHEGVLPHGPALYPGTQDPGRSNNPALIKVEPVDGVWVITEISGGSQLPRFQEAILLGGFPIHSDLVPEAVAQTLSLDLRGHQALLGKNKWKKLDLDETRTCLGNTRILLASSWKRISETRPGIKFPDLELFLSRETSRPGSPVKEKRYRLTVGLKGSKQVSNGCCALSIQYVPEGRAILLGRPQRSKTGDSFGVILKDFQHDPDPSEPNSPSFIRKRKQIDFNKISNDEPKIDVNQSWVKPPKATRVRPAREMTGGEAGQKISQALKAGSERWDTTSPEATAVFVTAMGARVLIAGKTGRTSWSRIPLSILSSPDVIIKIGKVYGQCVPNGGSRSIVLVAKIVGTELQPMRFSDPRDPDPGTTHLTFEIRKDENGNIEVVFIETKKSKTASGDLLATLKVLSDSKYLVNTAAKYNPTTWEVFGITKITYYKNETLGFKRNGGKWVYPPTTREQCLAKWRENPLPAFIQNDPFFKTRPDYTLRFFLTGQFSKDYGYGHEAAQKQGNKPSYNIPVIVTRREDAIIIDCNLEGCIGTHVQPVANALGLIQNKGDAPVEMRKRDHITNYADLGFIIPVTSEGALAIFANTAPDLTLQHLIDTAVQAKPELKDGMWFTIPTSGENMRSGPTLRPLSEPLPNYGDSPHSITIKLEPGKEGWVITELSGVRRPLSSALILLGSPFPLSPALMRVVIADTLNIGLRGYDALIGTNQWEILTLDQARTLLHEAPGKLQAMANRIRKTRPDLNFPSMELWINPAEKPGSVKLGIDYQITVILQENGKVPPQNCAIPLLVTDEISLGLPKSGFQSNIAKVLGMPEVAEQRALRKLLPRIGSNVEVVTLAKMKNTWRVVDASKNQPDLRVMILPLDSLPGQQGAIFVFPANQQAPALSAHRYLVASGKCMDGTTSLRAQTWGSSSEAILRDENLRKLFQSEAKRRLAYNPGQRPPKIVLYQVPNTNDGFAFIVLDDFYSLRSRGEKLAGVLLGQEKQILTITSNQLTTDSSDFARALYSARWISRSN